MAHLNIYPDGRVEIKPGPPPPGAKVIKKVNLRPEQLKPIPRPKLTVKPFDPCCTGDKR